MQDITIKNFIQEKHGKGAGEFLHALPPAMGNGNEVEVNYFEEETPLPHWHYITSSFHEAEFELTLRLAKKQGETHPPQWPLRMFNELLAFVLNSGELFRDQDYMEYTNGPLDADIKTEMIGAMFVKDEELGVLESPEGRVLFLQVFPLFADELKEMKGEDSASFVEKIKASIPSLVLDLSRTSILKS